MKPEGILKIEESLRIKLPEDYRNTIMNNPLSAEVVSERLNISIPNPYDRKDFKKGSYELKIINAFCDTLYDDPDMVIILNNRLRKKGLKNKPWLDFLLAIGYVGVCSTYYFINLKTNDNGVYVADNTKDSKYNPENIRANLLYSDMKEFLVTPLIALRGEEKIRKGIPEQPINVNEFLMKMNEEILKQQKRKI